MVKKNKSITKLSTFFCIMLINSQQIILAMGTPPNPQKEPSEQITEQTEPPISTPESPKDTNTEDSTREQIVIISPETQTIATPEIKSQDTLQTQNSQVSQETHISQDSKNMPEASTIVTLNNVKPVETEIQIRSDIKEQLRWLQSNQLSKSPEAYVLIKLNPGQTIATIDTQTNTKNFIYIDPSRPNIALDNGLFLWKKDEQIIETTWGELYLLRTHPESIYTCAFKTPDDDTTNDSADNTDAQAPENNKSRDNESNNNKSCDNTYCLFREKENLWGWEEPLETARQKFPDFDKELKNATMLSEASLTTTQIS